MSCQGSNYDNIFVNADTSWGESDAVSESSLLADVPLRRHPAHDTGCRFRRLLLSRTATASTYNPIPARQCSLDTGRRPEVQCA